MAVPVGYVLTVVAGVEAHGYQNSEFMPPSAGPGAFTVFKPLGGTPLDEAACTLLGTGIESIEADEECRAWYLGPAQAAFTGARIVVDVQTACNAPTYCEIGICKGTPVLCNGPSALTLVKSADASAIFNVAGPQYVDLAAMTVAVGDHLWLAWSNKKNASPQISFRGCLPDAIMSGMFVYKAAQRLSTLGAATDFDRCSSTERGIDSTVRFS